MTLLAVAGLSRCGSSLTMQMLAAGGVSCAGRFPAFEDEAINHRPIETDWLQVNDGRAFKWLDPHHASLPPGERPGVAVLWLDRNPKEQARSQAKFAHLLLGLPMADRSHLRRWTAGLLRDRVICRRQYPPTATAQFEAILLEPDLYAAQLAMLAWTLLGVHLDQAAAAAVCRARGPACAAGLDIEVELVAQAEASRRG